MNDKTALIQLVSEQTMQNLLPILALEPDRVVHLATPKVTARAAHIAEAARQAGVSPTYETIGLSEMPGIQEVARIVRDLAAECLAQGLRPVVNFTGGTKLMSVGAFAAAQVARVASLYVDTEHRRIVDGQTGAALPSPLDEDPGLAAYVRRLCVNAVVAANGCGRVTGGRDPKPFLDIARHLLANPEDERAMWEAVHGPSGLCPGGREPRDAPGWLSLLGRDVSLPDGLSRLAVAASLVEAHGEKVRLPESLRRSFEPGTSGRGYFEAVRPAQFVLSFLSGGWWEVAVLDAAQRSGLFRDLRWSVECGDRGPSGSMEEDIVGLDGAQLVYVSCKRGGQRARLFPLLEELDARARRMGGRFVRKYLAIYAPPFGATAAALRRRADELDIRLLVPSDIADPSRMASP